MSEWKIYFYVKSNNKKIPVKDFISDQEKIKRIKIYKYISLLKEKGISIGRPYLDKLEGKIYELRPSQQIRILFSTAKNKKIILLTGFIKKTKKVPQKEINKAKRHFKDFKFNSKITLNS